MYSEKNRQFVLKFGSLYINSVYSCYDTVNKKCPTANAKVRSI